LNFGGNEVGAKFDELGTNRGKEGRDLENEAREMHLEFTSKQKKAELLLQKAKRDQEERAERRYSFVCLAFVAAISHQ
jgi:hypothetical protein